MLAFLFKALLIVGGIILLLGVTVWNRRKLKQKRSGSIRQRLPGLVLMIGWITCLAAMWMGTAGFAAREGVDPRPMRIASVVLIIVGVLIMLGFRNWYIEPGPHEVRFRTLFGREKRIAYADITAHRVSGEGRLARVRIRAADGTRLSLNTAIFDATPILTALRARA